MYRTVQRLDVYKKNAQKNAFSWQVRISQLTIECSFNEHLAVKDCSVVAITASPNRSNQPLAESISDQLSFHKITGQHLRIISSTKT